MAKELAGKSDGYIELSFGPRWKYIAVVRGFIQNFLAVSLQDNTRADQVAMAASELLENAVKYASDEDIQIAVNVKAKDGNINISVSNSASPAAIETLKSTFQKVSQGNPLEAYISLMREAATRKDGKSQLGLARIRYETGLEMALDVKETMVTVCLNTKK
jgi:hypothetical protein